MLKHDIRYPAEPRDGAPVIVLMHGRGADERDLASLQPALPADAVLVLPQAPFPGEPWGYGSGWAWYRFLGDSRPEPVSFDTSLQRLEEFLNRLTGQLAVRPGTLTLGGFSQGGTLALAYALSRGGVAQVLMMSGFLADHPAVEATPATVGDTRFFWGHGTHDPAIPHQWAEAGRAALRRAGADLEAHDYAMGHWITPEELADARSWLEAAKGPHLAD